MSKQNVFYLFFNILVAFLPFMLLANVSLRATGSPRIFGFDNLLDTIQSFDIGFDAANAYSFVLGQFAVKLRSYTNPDIPNMVFYHIFEILGDTFTMAMVTLGYTCSYITGMIRYVMSLLGSVGYYPHIIHPSYYTSDYLPSLFLLK